MKEEELKYRQELIGLIGVLTKEVILSGYCRFKQPDIRSLDVWTSKTQQKKYDELIFVIQFSNNHIRNMMATLQEEHLTPAREFLDVIKPFLEDIKKQLGKYIIKYPVNINVELWIQEYIRVLSSLTGIVEGHGKNQIRDMKML